MFAAGDRVAVLGRLARVPRSRLARAIDRAGGRLLDRLGPRATQVVVGQGAARLLDDGRLPALLGDLAARGTPCCSELHVARDLGLAPPPAQPGTIEMADLPRLAGLAAPMVDALALLGVIDPVDGRVGFADVRLGRQIAALLADGVPASAIVAAVHTARATYGDPAPPLEVDDLGALLVRLDRALADPSGQLRLPLEAAAPSPDALLDDAWAALEAGDAETAARRYAAGLRARPADTVARFNRAAALIELGDRTEAAIELQRVTAQTPGFAEAWFNLGHLRRLAGDADGEIACLRRALAADPAYADACFQLALALFRSGRLGESEPLWLRYIELAGPGAAADELATARTAWRACRLASGSDDMGIGAKDMGG